MNNFKEIKKYLNCQEVVQRYLGLPEKQNSTGNWYKSPFRNEKTASFCVSNKGIHDFGSNEHYDIISFTEKYYKISPLDALKMLSNDFNIPLTMNEYENKITLEIIKKRREEENEIKNKIEKWHNKELKEVIKQIRINKKCLSLLCTTFYMDCLKILYDEEIKLEYYFDILLNAKTLEDKTKIYFKEFYQ